MSREVIDEGPAVEAGPVTGDRTPQGASPPRGAGPARRRVRLPWLAALAVGAGVLGAVLGAWQTRLDAQRSLQADTRLVLWDANLQESNPSAVGAAEFTATGRSLGGPVLVHELRMPYGNVTFSPDIALDPAVGHQLRIELRPDCSSYAQWADDLAKAPRTATAMVRDLPGDPLRPVPVELTGDFVIAVALVPCAQQAENGTVAGPAASGTPTIVNVTAMTGSNQNGRINLHLPIAGGLGSGRPVSIRLKIGDAYAGLQPGTFRLDPRGSRVDPDRGGDLGGRGHPHCRLPDQLLSPGARPDSTASHTNRPRCAPSTTACPKVRSQLATPSGPPVT